MITFQPTVTRLETKSRPVSPPPSPARPGKPWRCWAVLAFCGLALAGARAGLVQNPSFESNYNDTWPHYGPIDLWDGGSGVNEKSGPFHNSQTDIPDQTRAGFKQGNGTLGQSLTGLIPGRQYWVQFYYDARNGSQKVDITVSFNGTDVGKVVNVLPAFTKNLPYYFASFPFTPDADSGQLVFTVAVTGDSTALFDAVTVVQRDAGNVVVANPSFEASGDVPGDGITTGGLAGWQGSGSYGINSTGGAATYANNGTAPDQDHVAVLRDVSSLSQIVKDLVPGKPYQLSFAYNATTGTSPHLQVKVGDTVAYEENVTAVGGANPYRTKTVTFTAADFSATITFAQTAAGTGTLLLDDVKLQGETAVPLPPLGISPAVAEISPGQRVTATVTVPDVLLKARAVDVKLRSMSPQVAHLLGAGADGVLVLHFAKDGAGSQTFDIEGLARGSALLDVVDSGGLKVLDTLTVWVVTSYVKNASFESAPAPAGVGYGEILGWTGGSGVNTAAGPFLDNGLVPDRTQVAFLQGTKTLSQTITGLTPGENYWLQFFYNARGFGNTTIDLAVRFEGNQLAKITGIGAVGAGNPFNFTNLVFKPTNASGLLEFATSTAADATLLLDAVNIMQRDPVDLVVVNPSFEASGTIIGGVGYMQGTPMAGWAFQGAGYGINVPGRDPFSDNGANPDQDTVLFMQNAGNIAQTLTGLTAGKKYTIVIWLNPRNCCGGAIQTTVRVSVDDGVLLEEAIQPVGGANPYLVRQLTFTAAGTEAVLKIEHAPEAGTDRSVVLDNVRVVPEGKIPPILLTQPQGAARVLRGDNLSLSVTAMGTEPLTYQWQLNGVSLPGKTATNLDLTGLTPQQSGKYTVTVSNGVGAKTSRAAVVTVHERVAGGFNSGVDANGGLLAFGAVDPHWTLFDNPNDTNSHKAYVVTDAPDTWVANPAGSQWIGPVAAVQAEPMPNVGFYKYRLTFDLTGYDPASTFIAGSTAAAQGVDDLYLNDQVVPNYRRAGAAGSFAPFVVSSGFKSGLNTFDVRVFVTSSRQPAGVHVSDLVIGAQTTAVTAKLSVALQGAQVKIVWPAAASGYALQSSAQATGGWADEAATAVQEADNWTIKVTPAGKGRFYRLIKR